MQNTNVQQASAVASTDLAPRILGRELARPLTPEEIEIVGGALSVSTETGCPANDCDA